MKNQLEHLNEMIKSIEELLKLPEDSKPFPPPKSGKLEIYLYNLEDNK